MYHVSCLSLYMRLNLLLQNLLFFVAGNARLKFVVRNTLYLITVSRCIWIPSYKMCCFIWLSTCLLILYYKMCCFLLLSTSLVLQNVLLLFFVCELSKSVWILYYEMCYHCLRVSESCITKYAITAYVCLNLVRQNVLLLSTCVESCMKIVLLLSTCVESCMTKCAIPVYVCWILYDKMCYCCLRVLNLLWQNVLLLPICIWIFQAERTFGVDSATFDMAFTTSEKRISGYFTAFTLSSFQNDAAPTFVTDVSIFSRTKCRLNKQVTDFWGSLFSC